MSDEITIVATFTVNRFAEIIARFPEQADAISGKTAFDIVASAQNNVAVDLGDLKNDITANRRAMGQWTVDVGLEYAAAVEYGSRPHMPPVDALRGWADRHGIDPWALAFHIKKYGTAKQPYLTPAAEAHREAFTMAFASLEMFL